MCQIKHFSIFLSKRPLKFLKNYNFKKIKIKEKRRKTENTKKKSGPFDISPFIFILFFK